MNGAGESPWTRVHQVNNFVNEKDETECEFDVESRHMHSIIVLCIIKHLFVYVYVLSSKSQFLTDISLHFPQLFQIAQFPSLDFSRIGAISHGLAIKRDSIK